MSEANREAIRECFRLYGEGRYQEVVARYFHDDAQWVDPPEFPDSGVHRGHAEIVEYLIAWRESWGGDFEMRLDEIVGEGDALVALGTFRGTGRESGVPASVEYAQTWVFRDGKIARTEVTLDREKALAEVG